VSSLETTGITKKLLLGRGDLGGGLLVVVDDDTDARGRGAELDLGSLLQGGLGVGQGAVEAVLALGQAALCFFLPGLDLGNLVLILVLELILSLSLSVLLAGVELLRYAWNGERSLLVGAKKKIRISQPRLAKKNKNIPSERVLTGSLMTEACWRPSPAGAMAAPWRAAPLLAAAAPWRVLTRPSAPAAPPPAKEISPSPTTRAGE
jgi:hypothetical protein